MSSLLASRLCLFDMSINYLIFNVSYDLEPLAVSFIGGFGYVGVTSNNKNYLAIYIYLHVIISFYRVITFMLLINQHIQISPLLPISFVYQCIMSTCIMRYTVSMNKGTIEESRDEEPNLLHDEYEPPIKIIISS